MLPITFDLAKYPTADTIRLLASLLERMTIANDLLNKQQSAQQQSQQRRASLQTSSQQAAPVYTRFHARLVPSIDIHSYLARILKYCPCANECFLSLLVYFDRMSKNSLALTGKPFTIDSFNIHRLIIAGVMVSSKFFSDVFYTNTRYAKVGGLPVSELNSLEIEFLKLNGFNLTVPISELQKYGDQLLKVGYMTQEMRKPSSFRHGRSSSFDQARSDVDKVCDLTQRMSLDEQQHYGQHQNYYYHSQQPVPVKRNSYQHSSGNNNGHQIRRMTSTNSLKESGRYANHYYEQPRHSRSSINLHQGFWKPSSPLTHQQQPQQQQQQQQQQPSYDENATSQISRRLSITSIHAPPFIPSSELLAQQQQQQQQQPHPMQSIYYYPPMGIPTPPPSASPVHYQSPSANSSSTSVSYPIMYL